LNNRKKVKTGAQSADSSKAYRKARAFNCKDNAIALFKTEFYKQLVSTQAT